jgi:hypothetical protein
VLIMGAIRGVETAISHLARVTLGASAGRVIREVHVRTRHVTRPPPGTIARYPAPLDTTSGVSPVTLPSPVGVSVLAGV